MIEVSSALLTPIIAATVAWIAWQQWKTARSKLRLDLFDRRMAIYRDAAAALALITRDGSARKNEAFQRMLAAWQESQFLFGREVVQHLDELVTLIMDAMAAEAELEDLTEGRRPVVARKYEAIKKLMAARATLLDLFKPYMLMDERRIQEMHEWVVEKNARRLSFADEHQR